MKSLLLTTGLCVVGAMAAVVAGVSGPAKPGAGLSPADKAQAPVPTPPAAGGGVVVHEWGTFTGFAASDGTHLAFHSTIKADLPSFVQTRQRNGYDVKPREPYAELLTKANGALALQRMETPVLYFYADAPTTVDVRVGFPQGALTEFYPPVKALGPTYGIGLGEGIVRGDVFDVVRGAASLAEGPFLDWGNVRIIPKPTGDQGSLVPTERPPTAEEAALVPQRRNHYYHARETDAALLQVTGPNGQRHEERLLFYRGLGNFTLPVTLTAKGNDRFELHNAGPDAIGSVFILRTGADGFPTRFAKYDKVAGRTELVLPPTGGSAGLLPDAIVDALVAEGLYPKEARAMVETWRASWLNEPGTRVLYTVPRPATDALLPLRVRPTPTATERVLVGRIDVMTPELESRMLSLAATANAERPLAKADADMIASLGRFVEQGFERVAKLRGGKGAGSDEVGAVRSAYYRYQRGER